MELAGYFAPKGPDQRVVAVPGVGLKVPIWILGSSLFGAQVAAALGLPFAFASHFAPAMMMQAIEIYRARFQPSAQLDRPYVMLGFNVFAAATDTEARYLRRRCSRLSSICEAAGRRSCRLRSRDTTVSFPRPPRRSSRTFYVFGHRFAGHGPRRAAGVQRADSAG